MAGTETALANPGLLGRVLDWLRAHTTPGGELADFSREELRAMADDLSLTEGDLTAMAAHAADNTALMEGMMLARGLDPAVVRQSFSTLLRDIERVCTRCRSTGRCRRELDCGTAAEHAHEFCPNAGTFDDLIDYSLGR